MHQLIRVGFSFGALAGVGGGTYGVYKIIRSSSSYKKLLIDTLLDTKSDAHQTNWGKRLASLGAAGKDTLVNSLQTIKDKTNPVATWTDLKNWCAGIINSPNNWGRELINVQTYCTFSIKEKLNNAIDESKDQNWEKALENLKGIEDNKELDRVLIDAKGRADSGAGKTEVRAWCTGVYNSPYKGKDNKDFKNASKICVTTA